MRDGIPGEQVLTVHEGIDVERIGKLPTVNLREAFFLPHNAPIVGNVAALVRHKGQRHLINSVPLVLRDEPDAGS